jgi:molybdopterin synthase catalytic subunit
MHSTTKIMLQDEHIDVTSIICEVGTETDGAMVSFIGRVKNSSSGKSVLYLEYEAYCEMARKQLRKVADDTINRWSVNNCKIIHRYGRIDIGEASVLIAVSAPHQLEAFQAVQYIIDTIKETVPIWKKEYFIDGSSWMHES